MKNNLNNLADKFIQHRQILGYSDQTLKWLRFLLNKFLNFLASINITNLDGITKETICSYQLELYQYINDKGMPNSVPYQNKILGVAGKFLKYLKERNYIIADPSCDIQYAKEPQKLPRSILTPTEARKIINAPDTKSIIGYRDRTILEVLYSSGIRKSEVNNLTLNDIDYTDGYIRIIEGKGKKDRIVPIGRIACRYLENYIKTIRPELIRDPYNTHLFLSLQGNKLSKNVVWEFVKKYAKKAGCKKNVYPHTFRHSCATSMLKNKADIRVIQELLGHASLDSTQVYTHVSITDLKEIHKKCHPREKDKE